MSEKKRKRITQRVRNMVNLVVATPIMGGQPQIFTSLRECCEILKLKEGTLNNFFSRGGKKWKNDDWVIFKDVLLKPKKRTDGSKKNLLSVPVDRTKCKKCGQLLKVPYEVKGEMYCKMHYQDAM